MAIYSGLLIGSNVTEELNASELHSWRSQFCAVMQPLQTHKIIVYNLTTIEGFYVQIFFVITDLQSCFRGSLAAGSLVCPLERILVVHTEVAWVTGTDKAMLDSGIQTQVESKKLSSAKAEQQIWTTTCFDLTRITRRAVLYILNFVWQYMSCGWLDQS